MIIDFHAHLGEEDHASEQRLREEYRRAEIGFGVLVPGGMIDVRRMTEYVIGEREPEDLVPRNDLVGELAMREPERFAAFFCADPHLGRPVVEDFERALDGGFSGLKLAPVVHKFSFSCPTLRGLFDVCAEHGVPVYLHTVYSAASRTSKVEILAAEHPEVPVVIGHMGFGPVDTDAIALARRFDNVFVETSGGSYMAVQQAVGAAGPGKVIFGTEFPLENPSVELRKIDMLGLSSDAFDAITGGNARALLGEIGCGEKSS